MKGTVRDFVIMLSLIAAKSLGFGSKPISGTPHIPHHRHQARHHIKVPNGKWMMRAHRSR